MTQLKNKKSFLIYHDLIFTLEKIPNELAGKLFKNILRFVNNQQLTEDDLLLDVIFEPIKQQLLRDNEKWQEISNKKAQAGKIGGQARAKNAKQTQANEAYASFAKHSQADSSKRSIIKQTQANQAVIDTVTDNDTDTVIVSEIDNESTNLLNIKNIKEDIVEIFDYWKKVMDSPKSILDPKRKSLIEKMLKNYNVDYIKRAIDGCKKSEFHMGHNKDGKKYHDITLICRDSTRLEGFHEMQDASNAVKSKNILNDPERYRKSWEEELANYEPIDMSNIPF